MIARKRLRSFLGREYCYEEGCARGTDRNNKQADADVKFLEDIANPAETHATETTQADNSTATDRTTKSNSTRTALNDSRTDLANGSRIIESKAALDRAKAWKGYQVALAGLDEGADTAAIEKDYQDNVARVKHYVRVEYAKLDYREGISQIGTITDTFAAFAQYDKAYVNETATAEKKFTDAAAPIIGENLECRSRDGNVVATVARAVSSSTFEIGRSSATMAGSNSRHARSAQRIVGRKAFCANAVEIATTLLTLLSGDYPSV